MNESTFKGKIKRLHPTLKFQHIESATTGVGIPDTYIIGTNIWIEFKYLQQWPVRPTTIVSIDHYTMAQRLWLKDQIDAGGRSMLILGVGRESLYFKGYDALIIGTLTRDELYGINKYDIC